MEGRKDMDNPATPTAAPEKPKAGYPDQAPQKMVRYREALQKLNNLYLSDINHLEAQNNLLLAEMGKISVCLELSMQMVETLLKTLVEKKVLTKEAVDEFNAKMAKEAEELPKKTKEYLVDMLERAPAASSFASIRSFIKSGFDHVSDEDTDEGGALDKKAEK
jgi:hypothetical protein